jgi:L-asparaginase II
VLVEVTRGDLVESRHRGAIAVVAPDGELLAAVGDPDQPIYLRSSAKPFQLAPFVSSGRFDEYAFGTDALAIMAASHSGEDRHVRLVQALLRTAGLTQAALRCGTHTPYDAETAERLIRDGEAPSPARHNCSGKHAGMVLFAKASGWPLETYYEPSHPIQQAALEVVSALTDVPVGRIATATDGCGVVTFGLPLRGLALAYARLVDTASVADPPIRRALARIGAAMMEHPILVGGERRRLDTALMRERPGALIAKGGAEGVQAIGLPKTAGNRGRRALGVALKIDDGGAARAVGAATCAALYQLGVLDQPSLSRLAAYASPAVRDPRGEVSGTVRAAFALSVRPAS